MNRNISARKEVCFHSAHRLRYHKGECKNLHGHSYRLVVHVVKNSPKRVSEETGMVVDFNVLSTVLKEIVNEGLHFGGGAPLDHSVILNKDDSMCEAFKKLKIRVCEMSIEPTAENIASVMSGVVQDGLNSHGRDDVRVVRVDVWETEKSCATWCNYGL